MWQRFDGGLQGAVLRASDWAEARGERDLSTRHLLHGLATEPGAPALCLLGDMGISAEAIGRNLAGMTPGEGPVLGPEPTLTPEARAAVERAYALAADLGDESLGGEHLLLALAREPDGSDAGRLLAGLGVTWERAGAALMARQDRRTRPPEGVRVPGLAARRLVGRVRGRARSVKHLAFGLAHRDRPFMPYLLFRRRTLSDPYPFYHRLRRPCYWDETLCQWIVTGYEDVVAALAETRLSQRVFGASHWSRRPLPPLVEREFRRLHTGLDRQMLFLDAPDQTRQRARVGKRFTPRVLDWMRARMQETTDGLLDAAERAGQMEVVADLAVPMPLTVIALMLGIPEDDAGPLKRWSADLFTHLTGESSLAQDLATYHSAQEATAYFGRLIPERRRHPQDDLLSLLLAPGAQGDVLTEDEVAANALMLLATGHENTTRLIAGGLQALLRHPSQWERLRGDPALVGPAVEELLRYDSPVQWTMRVIQEDLEWRGHALKAGQWVRIGLAAANRDPARFPDPDRLDITRADNRHVAFGYGPHFCLGAALARMEGQIVLETVLRRFPRLRLADADAPTQDALMFRGPRSLRVRWD